MSETERGASSSGPTNGAAAFAAIWARALRSTELQHELKFYALLIGAFAVTIVYRSEVNQWAATGRSLLPVLISAVIAAVFVRSTMAELSRATAILLRTIFGLFGLYLLFGFPAILGSEVTPLDGFALGLGRYLAALAALGAFFRPSLGLVPLAYVLWYKGFQAAYAGIRISGTDYVPLIDVATFLTISGLCALLAKRFSFFRPLFDPPASKASATLTVFERLLLFGIAIHMANYFYSGWKKLFLGEHLLSWALHNQTQLLMLTSFEMGQLPLSFNSSVMNLSYESFGQFVVLGNFIILFGQLFALVAMTRIRWALWTVLFYDITHIAIFLTTGIFFYKWIVLNTSIAIALSLIRHKTIPLNLAAALAVAIVAAPSYFFVAKLGWWDTPALNYERFEAMTADGRSIPIPSNYFGIYSITAAQQRILSQRGARLIPTRTSGNTQSEDLMRKAVNCDFDSTEIRGDLILTEFRAQENRISQIMNRHHRWVLDHAAYWGGWYYDFYPHHIFSMPWSFAEFRRLDPKEIVKYRYVVEAVCLRFENGVVERKVLSVFQHDIDLAAENARERQVN